MGNSDSARYGDGRDVHDTVPALLRAQWREILDRAAARWHWPHAGDGEPASVAPSSTVPAAAADHANATTRHRLERIARDHGADPAEAALLWSHIQAGSPRARAHKVGRRLRLLAQLETGLVEEAQRLLRGQGGRVPAPARALLRTHLLYELARTALALGDRAPAPQLRAGCERAMAQAWGGRRTRPPVSTKKLGYPLQRVSNTS